MSAEQAVKDLEYLADRDYDPERCIVMHKKRMERLRRQQDQEKRRRYFIQQKLIGAVVLILTALAVLFSDGDATIAIITIPVGLLLLFSGDMLIMTDYYWKKIKDKRSDI